MQLFIIAITIPWLIILSKTSVYKYFRVTGAALSAMAALAWMAERSSGNANFITRFLEQAACYGAWGIFILAFASVLIFYADTKRSRKPLLQ
jgi:hypothetical protein